MDTGKLYQSIFRRKSVRSYETSPLEASVTDKIASLIPGLKPLYDIRTDISIVPGDSIRGIFAIKAPHYLVFSSENTEGYLENAGFILQQMDLALSSMGLGSCWVGFARPSREIPVMEGMEFVIAMAFGKPMGSPYRESLSEFKRKPLEKIANALEDPFLEAARLAPSSTNSQPWYFIRSGNKVHVYCRSLNRLTGMFYEKFNRMDVGIACCHIWLAGLRHGKDPVFMKDRKSAQAIPGYEYILTVSGI
ncbi:MAG: nitroreductase [Clostridiaceae bacterium]|nr:nitroreductase [Clostridiaceae bacterium]